MATPKKTVRKYKTPGISMSIWMADEDVKNMQRIATAHGISRCAAVRLAVCTLREAIDREESKPLLPAVGS